MAPTDTNLMPSVCSCHSLNIPKCSSVTKSPRGPAWPKSVTHREMEEAPQCSSLCAVSMLDSSASSTQQPQPFPGIHPTQRSPQAKPQPQHEHSRALVCLELTARSPTPWLSQSSSFWQFACEVQDELSALTDNQAASFCRSNCSEGSEP